MPTRPAARPAMPDLPADVRLRPAVRAVIADEDDRVLLCRWHFEDPDGPADVWGTPGGGIEPDEDVVDALRRELAEETGLELDREACGPVVAHRRHVVPMSSTDGRSWDGQEEWLFLLRVEHFTPRGQLTDEQLLAESLTELTWLGLDDVRALGSSPGTHTSPRDLATFVADLLRDGRPEQPWEILELDS